MKVSICIPAYNKREYFEKCLASIEAQNFKDYEVVITDDSEGSEIQDLVEASPIKQRIRYEKNSTRLGSPKNWDRSIALAKGEYIKILHYDDWFSGPDSLGVFVERMDAHKDVSLAFCLSVNCDEKGNLSRIVNTGSDIVRRIERDPMLLFSDNLIGAPSATIFRRGYDIEFDEHLKWLVDVDFYIRYLDLSKSRLLHIQEPLVNIMADGPHRVTASSLDNEYIEFYEHLYTFNKYKKQSPKYLNFIWKLFDKYKVNTREELEHLNIPEELISRRVDVMMRFKSVSRRISRAMKLAFTVLSPIFLVDFVLRQMVLLIVNREKEK